MVFSIWSLLSGSAMPLFAFSVASSALKIARMRRKFNFSTHFPGLFPFWTASLCQQHIILSIPQKFSPDYTQFFHIITVK